MSLNCVAGSTSSVGSLAGDWKEKLEFGRELILGVESVREVNSTDPAVGVDLDSEGLNIVGTVGSSCEIGQVELDLIPAFIKSHRHCADEGLDTSSRLIVRGSESSPDVLVIKDLHLKGEVLLEVLNNHNEER